MRDWRAFVREHLGAFSGNPSEQEQVVSELAGHLEEHYEVLRAEGLSDDQAFKEACARSGNWADLRRGIISASQEGTMNDRVKQIWAPVLVTLVLAGAVLTILFGTARQPMIWHLRGVGAIILFVPWLLLLPVIGGIGAYLSRRGEGSGWRVYVSGLAPALAWGVVFVLVSPFAFLVNPQVAPSFKIFSILAMVISLVILPGIALSVGVAAVSLKARTSPKL